ncbi:MAG TPA: Ig-like domain-containing protein, partial [Acidobacteriota bacterium]|nr:Ig-like domain-containing protein [Acidobacteriota bacterium]
EPLQIRWQSSDAGGALASHAIDLSVDGGTTFGTSVAAGLGATAQSFVFQIPTTIASATARIRVTARDTAGNNGQDTSDANFTIKSTDTVAPTVTVTAPAAGQKVKVTGSSSFTVTWTSSDNIGVASHDVLLAKDGTTFQNLATGLSGTTTTLSLTQSLVGPAGKSKAAKLRVVARDAGGNSGTGETGAFKLIVK